MALNVIDGAGAAKTVKTTIDTGDHVPHHVVDSSVLPTGASTEASLVNVIAALANLATQATLAAALAKLGALQAAGADTVSNTLDRAAAAAFGYLYNGATWDRMRGDVANGLDVDVTRSALPTGAMADATFTARVPTNGQKTMAGSLPIVMPSDQQFSKVASNAVHTNVAAAAADTQLLAANASRIGFTVYNDSSSDMYLKYATGASVTSMTALVKGGGFYEDPWGWPGVVNARWATATGTARIMEIS